MYSSLIPRLCVVELLSSWCQYTKLSLILYHQMVYAAHDAQISVALFFHLLGKSTEPRLPAEGDSMFVQLASCCQGLVDVPFRARYNGEGEEGERRRRSRKSTVESPESGDQQVPDPRRNKRKPLGVGYSAR